MKDITSLMNRYRECVRNLWNTYFFERLSQDKQWDVFDEYCDISSSLFSALVLNAIDRESCRKTPGYEKAPQPLAFLRVIPMPESGVPININRQIPSSGYWDHPVTVLKASDADMRFVDYFDYDVLGFRDLQYCRVRIVGSEKIPDLVGRDALIGSSFVRIVVDESLSDDCLVGS